MDNPQDLDLDDQKNSVPQILTEAKTKRHKCDICSKDFSRLSHLKDHLRLHSKEKPFTCHICSKAFSRKRNLVAHARTHTNEKPFTCDVCSKNFSSNWHLKDHLQVHMPRTQMFPCDICDKALSSKNALRRHYLRTHTDKKPYACKVGICNKAFYQMCDLKRHLLMHKRENLFTCHVCAETFPEKSLLKSHLKEAHKKKGKPFTCGICNKTLSSTCYAKLHLLTHTKEKSFVCDICSKAFALQAHLRGHVQRMHK